MLTSHTRQFVILYVIALNTMFQCSMLKAYCAVVICVC
jgi:hypothetical protein